MPNWCENGLYVAGEPEDVEAFRIVNAQHTQDGDSPLPRLGLIQGKVGKSLEDPGPVNRLADLNGLGAVLVRSRERGDLSFTAIDRAEVSSGWGTRFDVAGSVKHSAEDAGAWKLSPGVEMSRAQCWSFETASTAPELWLAKAATSFPSLSFVLGHQDPAMGIFHVYTAKGGTFALKALPSEAKSANKVMSMALSQSRKQMAMHRKPSPLLKAVWEDDVKKIKSALSRSTVAQINGEIQSGWTALMHAAHTGSRQVALALMDAGADPSHRVTLGWRMPFGMADICMDCNVQDAADLVAARQDILLQAVARCPELATNPLCSGVSPLTLALKYQMDPVVAGLFSKAPVELLDALGESTGVVRALSENYGAEVIRVIASRLDEHEKNTLYKNVIEIILEDASSPKYAFMPVKMQNTAQLFMDLHDAGHTSDHDMKRALGEAEVRKVVNNAPLLVNDAFKSVVASHRAHRAIDSMMRAPGPSC